MMTEEPTKNPVVAIFYSSYYFIVKNVCFLIRVFMFNTNSASQLSIWNTSFFPRIRCRVVYH
jgi:hypothetical protein